MATRQNEDDARWNGKGRNNEGHIWELLHNNNRKNESNPDKVWNLNGFFIV